jgi:hypothetical protein
MLFILTLLHSLIYGMTIAKEPDSWRRSLSGAACFCDFSGDFQIAILSAQLSAESANRETAKVASSIRQKSDISVPQIEAE